MIYQSKKKIIKEYKIYRKIQYFKNKKIKNKKKVKIFYKKVKITHLFKKHYKLYKYFFFKVIKSKNFKIEKKELINYIE